jgi:AraC-like DNA-binding protein
MISIQTYTPKTLFPLIKSFWCLKVDRGETAYEEEIIPDGHHEIIFHLNSKPAKRKTGNNRWQEEPVAFFAGQDLRSFKVQIMPNAMIYGIRFQPHTQALFFNFPASITTDQPLSLDDVKKATPLWNCISEQPEETFSNLERFFLTQSSLLNDVPKAFAYVDVSVREILHCKGNIKVDQLVEKTDISARHLDSSFQEFVGVNPKTFCNLIKFNHFVNYRKQNPSKSLTECAHHANFYDQSHLIHMSNAITGKSPKGHFGEGNRINDFFIDI